MVVSLNSRLERNEEEEEEVPRPSPPALHAAPPPSARRSPPPPSRASRSWRAPAGEVGMLFSLYEVLQIMRLRVAKEVLKERNRKAAQTKAQTRSGVRRPPLRILIHAER